MYYKVKEEYDNYPRFVFIGSQYFSKQDGILVGNELYTPTERNKLANSNRFFDIVEISRRKTHRFFGARFEDKN